MTTADRPVDPEQERIDALRRQLQETETVFGDTLNKHLSAAMSRLDDDQRTRLFGQLDDAVRADLDVGKPVDLLRSIRDAVMWVDPLYDSPNLDPTREEVMPS